MDNKNWVIWKAGEICRAIYISLCIKGFQNTWFSLRKSKDSFVLLLVAETEEINLQSCQLLTITGELPTAHQKHPTEAQPYMLAYMTKKNHIKLHINSYK